MVKPFSVSFAIFILYVLLSLSMIVIFFPLFLGFSGYTLHNFISYGLVIVFNFFIIRKISGGKNWARILFTLLILLNTLIELYQFTVGPPLSVGALIGIFTAVLLIVSQALLLFSQSANKWFSYKKSLESDPWRPQ